MGPHGALPGFLAISRGAALDGAVGDASQTARILAGPAELAYWGIEPLEPGSSGSSGSSSSSGSSGEASFALSQVRRRARGEVPADEIAGALRDDPRALARLLPPFAAVCASAAGVSMIADSMGFRQLFHSTPGHTGTSVLSTSAILAARAGRAGRTAFDSTAVAVQSMLGWQLGQRTVFQGIDKLPPGATAELNADGVRLQAAAGRRVEELSIDEAVSSAAALLRTSLEALLDDHPDAVLQLTGGQDSRILLSAVPPARRRGLRAMTLGIAGSGDVVVASALAARDGLRHEVHDLADLAGLEPAEAWAHARAASIKLDAMSDPIALAALTVAEGAFDQGVRISGLGGEVARGFYYVGPVHDRAYTRSDVAQLAAWRMFANEAVEPGMLDAEYAGWARQAAEAEVYAAMTAAGAEWFRATDELYLRHRMQRWAGATDTAVGYQRVVLNPMLDEQFISIASRLRPEDKAHSRFLARLQVKLDPELGRIPLEGRPAPVSYADPSPWRLTTRAVGTGRRAAKKVVQRLRRGNRPPAGGAVLADKVVEHWRSHPALVSDAPIFDFVRRDWVDSMLGGDSQPRPSSVGFLTNLIVAGGSTD
ncbi:hypothetical protein [Agromyces badenianii]|uniref:hypothetical protein n=1 Tax=Agromyces badenianii TaxID=2080742 RepID=UPI000D591DD0|nr:hypothetical protein [Agromyces badenianii]PWC05164.1 hypothetical protein DCE94_02345 [Agromyces badenianii]